ncbi:phosphotransferase [Methylobrevis sp. L22]|uniref:Phosphotransferase n=2 Tax=Methylobrevis albus TaxID=2793297 RepID=A0A931HZT0_9HYPH|nr:phosphotransferase [Methylobrevis albus]
MTAMVAAGAGRWGLSPRTDVRLLNISENATFLLDDPEEGRRLVLRLHRIGYHTAAEIHAELAWIDALRAGGVVETPAPLAATDGTRVLTLGSPGGLPPRQAVAFDFVPGREPAPSDELGPWFQRLGAVTARMQAQARAWQRPDGFVRKRWDFDAMIGSRPYWGRWQDGLGLDPAGRALIGRAAELIAARLDRFGSGPDRFGLIHADLRLANLLVDGDRLTIIDFDDCGLSWFAYDFAAAVSFFEHDPVVPALMQAWTAGFRSVAPLGDDVVAELPVFVMLRRILLVAWIASHAETPTAQEMGVPYTQQTLAMAEDLLTRFG